MFMYFYAEVRIYSFFYESHSLYETCQVNNIIMNIRYMSLAVINIYLISPQAMYDI